MKQIQLFENTSSGAEFSECHKYRYALWRIWDASKPFVMFIGLNPSTANETTDDNTIRRVKSFAHKWGYGGVYMMNCFAYISTDPNVLIDKANDPEHYYLNNTWLMEIKLKCSEVIFAWGSFDIVKQMSRDQELIEMFPKAKALIINQDGSPRHPLYVPNNVIPVLYNI